MENPGHLRCIMIENAENEGLMDFGQLIMRLVNRFISFSNMRTKAMMFIKNGNDVMVPRPSSAAGNNWV